MFTRLRDEFEVERRRLLIGRESELEWVTSWLLSDSPPTQMFSVTGMAGVGKTTLLSEMASIGRSNDAVVLWLDGYSDLEYPENFLNNIHRMILDQTDSKVNMEFLMDDLAHLANGRKVLLCIDPYDNLLRLDGWFRNSFLPNLPSHSVLLALTCRVDLPLKWRSSPWLFHRIKRVRLECFTREETLEFANRCGIVDKKTREELYFDTAGHPLALALAIEAVLQQIPDYRAILSREISVKLIQDVAGSNLHPLLDALTVLREADQDLFSLVLQRPVSLAEFQEIGKLSFVYYSTNGLILDDSARSYLLEEMRARSVKDFIRLHRLAINALWQKLEQSSGLTKNMIAVKILLFSIEAASIIGYPWSGAPSRLSRTQLPECTSLSDSDIVCLHELMRTNPTAGIDVKEAEELHVFLDQVVRYYPESVRIIRKRNGLPIAFVVMLPFHNESLAVLPADARNLLKNCLPKEFDKNSRLTANLSHTYLLALACIDEQNPEFDITILHVALATDYFEVSGVGNRLLSIGKHTAATAFYTRLGFRPVQPILKSVKPSLLSMKLFTLDLRSNDVSEWVADLLHNIDKMYSSDRSIAIDPVELRMALSHLDNDTALTAIANKLGCTESVLRDRVRVILTGKEVMHPLSKEQQRVLCATYLETQHYTVVIQSLYMNRSTYYRHLKQAIMHLADILQKASDI